MITAGLLTGYALLGRAAAATAIAVLIALPVVVAAAPAWLATQTRYCPMDIGGLT